MKLRQEQKGSIFLLLIFLIIASVSCVLFFSLREDRVGDAFKQEHVVKTLLVLEKENIVPLKDVDIKMIEDVKASGNKIEEVNLFMRLITAKNQLNAQKKSVNQKVNYILKCPKEQIDLIQLRTSEVTYEAIKALSVLL